MRTNYADFFQTIFDCVADGIFTVDKNRRITSFNRAAERIEGTAVCGGVSGDFEPHPVDRRCRIDAAWCSICTAVGRCFPGTLN
ncbi:MAG: PAS domain-containing protein [Syntrophales bacterium]